MGKKQQGKDEAPNPQSVANREIFQRLNFLYQASAYLKGLEGTEPGPSTMESRSLREVTHTNSRKRHKVSLGDLGSTYVRNMQTIGNKTVARMDPNVKRMLCKGCNTVLFPGTTASIRVKGSPSIGRMVVYTCLECKKSRKIPAPPVASVFVPNEGSSSGVTMICEDASEAPEPANMRQHRKKHKTWVPHPLPLFARQEAGHVVFCGNEVLYSGRE